jgi:hypothetical protein
VLFFTGCSQALSKVCFFFWQNDFKTLLFGFDTFGKDALAKIRILTQNLIFHFAKIFVDKNEKLKNHYIFNFKAKFLEIWPIFTRVLKTKKKKAINPLFIQQSCV